MGIAGQVIRLAKWEDIKNVKISEDKGKLESFKFKTEIIFPDQYYSSEDIDEINKYIQMRMKND